MFVVIMIGVLQRNAPYTNRFKEHIIAFPLTSGWGASLYRPDLAQKKMASVLLRTETLDRKRNEKDPEDERISNLPLEPKTHKRAEKGDKQPQESKCKPYQLPSTRCLYNNHPTKHQPLSLSKSMPPFK